MAVVYALVTPRKVVLHLVLQMLISVGSFLFGEYLVYMLEG